MKIEKGEKKMKYSLASNENLIIEILEMYYEQNKTTKEIYKKINKKICMNNIRKIIREHKLFIEFKKSKYWFNNSG